MKKKTMYRIKYSYFKRSKKEFDIVEGQPIHKELVADSLKKLMTLYNDEKQNHDLFQYSMFLFESVEEFTA